MLKLLKIIKPYRLVVAFIVLLIFLQVLAELWLPTLMANIVDVGIVQGDTRYIIKLGLLMLLTAAGATVCAFIASYYTARVSAKFGQTLRSRVFTQVEGFSLQEFDQLSTASLINRTTNDINQVQQLLTMLLRLMMRAPLMCAGGIIMAVAKDARLSLVIVAAIPILALGVYWLVGKSMPLFKAVQAKLDKLNLLLRESLSGVRVIRAFNREVYEQGRFDTANRDFSDTAIKVNQIMATMMPLMMLVMNFTIVLIIWFGSVRIEQGGIQVGDLMAFIQYVMMILFSLLMFSMLFVMLPRASVSAARINEVLDIIPAISDAAVTTRTKPDLRPGLGIKFEQVTFSYPGAEQPALTNLSFTAEPGEVTAIIGGTGSGKSTLLNLISRFYDVDSGNVLVDGVDVRCWSQADLRAEIGMVPQSALLFSGNIAENIRYGKQEATDQEVRRAAEIAQAAQFIDAMPDGLATVLAQGGTNVSGGQKQRLTIARALVRNPRIYLFDDSFSALDFKTDAALRATLSREIAGATVLLVTQRVSTVLHADKIIVLEQGRLVGMGRHQELLENCGVYHEIVESQLTGEATA